MASNAENVSSCKTRCLIAVTRMIWHIILHQFSSRWPGAGLALCQGPFIHTAGVWLRPGESLMELYIAIGATGGQVPLDPGMAAIMITSLEQPVAWPHFPVLSQTLCTQKSTFGRDPWSGQDHHWCHIHYTDVIMTTMVSQITSLTVVYSTVYSAQIKENIEAPRHWPLRGDFTGTGEKKGQLCGKCFHLMSSSCEWSMLFQLRYSIAQIAELHKIDIKPTLVVISGAASEWRNRNYIKLAY